MAAQRRFDTTHRGGTGSGLMGTLAGLLILAGVVYVAYTFAVSSGLLA